MLRGGVCVLAGSLRKLGAAAYICPTVTSTPAHWPRTIDVWLAFPQHIRDKRLLSEYEQILSADERRRMLQYRFERDQHRYLVTRALVRIVLSRYARVAPADWVFQASRYGRPQICDAASIAATLSFNVSHTHGLILLAVTAGEAIGVDVENCDGQRRLPQSPEYFLAEQEASALRAVPLAARNRRFLEYWTLKEAYVKARGIGLSLGVDRFHFSFTDETRVILWTHEQLEDDPSRWRFWQFRPTPEHCAALCVERSTSQMPQLTATEIVPLRHERLVALTVTRTSA